MPMRTVSLVHPRPRPFQAFILCRDFNWLSFIYLSVLDPESSLKHATCVSWGWLRGKQTPINSVNIASTKNTSRLLSRILAEKTSANITQMPTRRNRKSNALAEQRVVTNWRGNCKCQTKYGHQSKFLTKIKNSYFDYCFLVSEGAH